MTIVYFGPWCLVCDGTNVIKRDEHGITAWNSNGPVYGRVRRDVCLDCERRTEDRLNNLFSEARSREAR